MIPPCVRVCVLLISADGVFMGCVCESIVYDKENKVEQINNTVPTLPAKREIPHLSDASRSL